VTSNQLTLQIEPRPDCDGIAGRLRNGNGEEHRFTGWLGRLTLLEQARLKAASDAGDSTQGVSR
jgi:hypothetical protein